MKKKILYRWHKRLGLSLGFILFLLGISGVVITYRDELLPIVYPEHFLVLPRSQRLPVEDLVRIAKQHLEETSITHLYTSERDDTATMIFTKPEEARLPHLLTIDPYSGVIKGEMPLVRNIFGVMLYVHANLLLGKTGSYVVGLMGILLLGFFLSGVMIFWSPRWREKMKSLPRQGMRGVHRATGIVLGLPLVFSAFTGFLLAFDLMQTVGRFMGEPKKPEEVSKAGACVLEDQLKVLRSLSIEAKSNIVSIHFCSKKNALMKISSGMGVRSGHHGFRKLLVDPATGTTLQTFDTNRDPASWSQNSLLIYPMHTGVYFGGIGRIVTLLTGVALATLYVTGVILSVRARLKSKIVSANNGLELPTSRIDLV